MQNSTSSVAQVFTNTNPIANRIKPIATRSNRQLDCETVDTFLETYSDIIDPQYTHWFAKHFYTLNPNTIHRAASEAKADGKDSRRLFAYLIKKYATRVHA